jgi:hypothetical protein
MGRRIVLGLVATIILGGIGYAAYFFLFSAPHRDLIEEPLPPSPSQPLSTADEFERLLREDPVAMLGACLVRYERDGIKGFTATLDKQERVHGELHERELIRLTGEGEVPEHPGEHPNIRVRMIWESGFRKVLGVRTLGTIYPNPETQDRSEMAAYTSFGFTKSVGIKDGMSRSASRYCIADAGLYRGMLRTYDAWRKRQAAGQLHARYLGKESPKEVGGRLCHVVRRTCTAPEVDPFALDEAPDAKADSRRDGAVEITTYIDAERWLQVGTILKRAQGDLLGEYFFRDVVLATTRFQPDPFTMEALKAALKK